jgi:hypothetical protein
VRSRKRGHTGPPRCYECGDVNHIHPNCPKFLARIGRDKDNNEEETERTKKHTLRSNKKKGHLNRKVVHRVLSALEQVNMSDVDTDSEDDISKGRRLDWALSNGK